jgi:hypothetical protein
MTKLYYKDNHDTYIKLERPIIKSYNNKIYDSKTKYYSQRLSDKEKKQISSRFQYKKNPITSKEVLLTIITFIIIFLLILYNSKYQDSIIFYCFMVLFFFIAIAFNYNVNSSFYISFIILYFIIIIIVSYININYKDISSNIKNNIRK